MKIAVISPNPAPLEELCAFLRKQDESRLVSSYEGGMSKARVVADQHRPDLIVLDSMCRDAGDLSVLEYVSVQHPQTAVVMLCANHSPEFLINAMRAGVREVLQSPASKEAVHAAVERIEQRLGLGAKPRQSGEIIAFMPCKGGSGATFLATNLGYQLAAENKKVILIDLNLQFGDAVLFAHDHKPATHIGELARNIHRLDGSFLAGSLVNVSPNYGMLAAPEDPGQAVEITSEHVDVLLNVAVDHYDFVILDLGRILDAVTVKALDRAKHVFPVLQMTLPFVRDAGRLLAAFRTLGYAQEKIRLIVNRFDKSGEIKIDDVERSLGLPIFKTLPNSYAAVAAAVNHGRPIASFARANPVAKALQELAQAMANPVTAGGGLFGKLLRRG